VIGSPFLLFLNRDWIVMGDRRQRFHNRLDFVWLNFRLWDSVFQKSPYKTLHLLELLYVINLP